MILDLPRVVAAERPYWTALEKTLDLLDKLDQDADQVRTFTKRS